MRRFIIGLALLLGLLAPPAAAQQVQSKTLTSGTCTGVPADTGCFVIGTSKLAGAAVDISGTFSGTIAVEGAVAVDRACTASNGNYKPLQMFPSGASTPVTSATAGGSWRVPVGGYAYMCVLFTNYVSGSAVITVGTAPSVGLNLGGSGGSGSGNANTTDPLSQFATTTPDQLGGVLSGGTTGTANFVRATSPTIAAPTLTGNTTVSTVNKLTLTAPAAAATLSIIDGTTVTGPPTTSTLATLGLAETLTGNKTFTGAQDYTGASAWAPKAGTSLPATCTKTSARMDMFLKTDATAGQNWYYCGATNTWTQQINTGGGDLSSNTSTSVIGELFAFADTGGKIAKRSTGSGWVKFTSGVASTITPGTGFETFAVTPTIANLGSVFGSRTANYFLAAPCGSSGNVTERLICNSDLPSTIPETIFTSTQNIGAWGSSYREHVSAAVTMNLPTAVGNVDATMAHCVGRDSTALVTLDAFGSQTIDGALTRPMRDGECAELKVDDTSNVTKIGGVSIPFSVTVTRQLSDSGVLSAGGNRITFDTKEYGPASMWDSGNGRPKIFRAGYYDIDMTCYIKGMTTSDAANVAIIVNGITAYGGTTTFNSPAGAVGFATYRYAALLLAVGDYVEAYVYINTGGAGTEKANGDTSNPIRLTLTETRLW